MTDHTLSRADEVLTELVELVETARTLPMSSSCVLPRERTLDLLDALRELLPPEVSESRRIVAQRDRMLAEAEQRASEIIEEANEQANSLVTAARVEAHNALEEARAEQDHLVSSATVHQAATEEAARLTEAAEQQAHETRSAAEGYAERLTQDAHSYAERTLSDLVETLQRLTATAENGRAALQRNGAED